MLRCTQSDFSQSVTRAISTTTKGVLWYYWHALGKACKGSGFGNAGRECVILLERHTSLYVQGAGVQGKAKSRAPFSGLSSLRIGCLLSKKYGWPVAAAERGNRKVRWAMALQSRHTGRRVAEGHSVGVGKSFHQAGGFTYRIVTPAPGGSACVPGIYSTPPMEERKNVKMERINKRNLRINKRNWRLKANSLLGARMHAFSLWL